MCRLSPHFISDNTAAPGELPYFGNEAGDAGSLNLTRRLPAL